MVPVNRIMFIHHSGAAGGAGVSLANNVALLSENNEVTVYISSEPRFIAELLHSNCPKAKVVEYGRRIGALTCYSGGDSVLSKRFLYRMLLIGKQFDYWNSVIQKEAPDVIILNSMILSWMSCLPALRSRKSILFVRETMQGLPKRWINKIIRGLLDKFSTVVFLCEYDRTMWRLPTAKAEVIHNSISKTQLRSGVSREDARRKWNLPHDSFIVLYVGGVNEMKGFDLAVQAVLNAGEDCHLIAAGNHFADAMHTASVAAKAYVEKWQNYVAEHDRKKQIHMLGRQSDMADLYAACDVLLFPMRSPHQARPVFEAGYYHKPVVITDFENIAEFVSDGGNGFKVPADSVDAILEKLLILKHDSVLARRMGDRNAAITAGKHDPDRNYQKLCKIIEETIQR